MIRDVEAIYEGGVLRPTEKLQLEEHQVVGIVVLDDEEDDSDEIHFVPPSEFESRTTRTVDREALLAELSKIPGSMDADIRSERNAR